MTRWGMAIDLDSCTSCGACTVACAQENNIAPGTPSAPAERLIRWIELMPIEDGEYPRVRCDVMPSPCQMCDRPPCTTVCPVYATYKDSEGLVPQIYHQCIGCRYCVNACPYTCKFFNWDDPTWPTPMERGLNPDVSVRTRGVTEKCNFCAHRIELARMAARVDEEEFDPKSIRPACAEVCPTKAIEFGDLDDPESAVSKAKESARSMQLLEELDVHQKVYYMERRE